MNIFKVLFQLFLLYLLYKLVFDFIIPMYNTTKQVKKQFGDMQHNLSEQLRRQQEQQQAPPAPQKTGKASGDDYIEYEEIK